MAKVCTGVPKTSQFKYTGKGLLDEKAWVQNLTDLKSLDVSLYNNGDVVSVIDEKKLYKLDTSLDQNPTTGYWRDMSAIAEISDPKINNNINPTDTLYRISSESSSVWRDKQGYKVKDGYQWYSDDVYLYYKLKSDSAYTALTLDSICTKLHQTPELPEYLEKSDDGPFFDYFVYSSGASYYYLTYLSPRSMYHRRVGDSKLTKIVDISMLAEVIKGLQSQFSSLFVATEVTALSNIKSVGTYKYIGQLGNLEEYTTTTWMITVQQVGTTFMYHAISTTDPSVQLYSNNATDWVYTRTGWFS